jgi:putative flippase GtrA
MSELVGAEPVVAVLGVAPALPLLPRLVRFAAVGASCYLIQLGLVHTLHGALSLYLADVVAFLISAQLNFALSQMFTWGDRREAESFGLRFVKFNANVLVSVIVVNGSVFWALVHVGFPFWSAMLAANVLSTAVTFVVNHYVVFRGVHDAQPVS